MKLKPNHIKTFEKFIQNKKDPNEKEQPEIKKKKIDDPDGIEIDELPDDENEDPIEEMKRYFEKKDKNYPKL